MRVQTQVEDIRSTGAERRSEKRKSSLPRFGIRGLVLGDDHDGRATDDEARILVHGALDPSGHHQADMRAVGHPVAVKRLPDRIHNGLTRHANVKRDGIRALEEAIHVGVKADQRTLDKAKPLPDTVAKDKATVEDGHARLVAGHEAAVDVDKDVFVARVRCVALCTPEGCVGGHQHGLISLIQ